jgi:hypothetical protein
MNAREKVDVLKEKAKPHIRLAFRSIPYIIIIFISMILVGLTEFIKADFDPRVFLSSNYLYNVLLLNGAGFLIALSATLSASDRIIQRDETGEIAKTTQALSEMAISLSDKRVDIFLKEVNESRKKIAWKEKISKKIVQLDRNARLEQTIQYAEYCDFENQNPTMSMSDKIKAFKKKQPHIYSYTFKRIKLTEHCKDEWIDPRIAYLKVRCKKITRMLLTTGVQFSVDDDIPNKPSMVLLKGLLPKFILTVSLTSIIMSFGLDFIQLKLLSAITITVKLMACIANYIYGRDFAPQYVRATTLDSLQKRIRWVKEYNEWKKEHYNE